MIHCFGDSWAVGAELRPGQHAFVHWIAQLLDQPYCNFGKKGSSLGLITYTVQQNLLQIQSDDLVLVVVPPDTRWYDQNPGQGFYSISIDQKTDFLQFLHYKTMQWFTYHHALFVYVIQKMLNDIGCRYIMMHNYGTITDLKQHNFAIDFSKFLSPHDLTTLLTKQQLSWAWPDSNEVLVNNIEHTDGPPADVFTGPFFQGCRQHPNELGHKEIARLVIEKYEQK